MFEPSASRIPPVEPITATNPRMADMDPLTQQPVAQPVAEPVAQPQPVAPQQQMAVAAPQQEMLVQQPVAIAAQQVQPQPVAQLVAAQATVATTALAATASYAYAEVPYEAPMTAEDALATAEREGLIMCGARARTYPRPHPTPNRNPRPRPLPPPQPKPQPAPYASRPRAESKTGFRGVTHVTGKKARPCPKRNPNPNPDPHLNPNPELSPHPHQARPFQAWVCREGKLERLGRFATPEEAALCRARTPEGKKAANRSARGGKSGPVPMTVEEAEAQAEAAEAQAEAEGLTLQRSENQTGYVGVYVNTSNKVKPFEARVRRGGQRVFIGHFATAEEAALEVARVVADEPEGKKK